MKYMVVIEEGPASWGAYVPDLPSCVAAGETRTEVVQLIHEAIEFHLEGLEEDGKSFPGPHSKRGGYGSICSRKRSLTAPHSRPIPQDSLL